MTECPFHSTPAASTSAGENIVAQEHAQLDFDGRMSYGDYLQLDAILNAQKPLSPEHNEMLFIVQHQTSELWLKLLIHELSAAIDHLRNDRVWQFGKVAARCKRAKRYLPRRPTSKARSAGAASWPRISANSRGLESSVFRPLAPF